VATLARPDVVPQLLVCERRVLSLSAAGAASLLLHNPQRLAVVHAVQSVPALLIR
jgi:hypothetical protein